MFVVVPREVSFWRGLGVWRSAGVRVSLSLDNDTVHERCRRVTQSTNAKIKRSLRAFRGLWSPNSKVPLNRSWCYYKYQSSVTEGSLAMIYIWVEVLRCVLSYFSPEIYNLISSDNIVLSIFPMRHLSSRACPWDGRFHCVNCYVKKLSCRATLEYLVWSE